MQGEGATLGKRQFEVLVPFGGQRHRGWFRSLTRPSGLQVHFFDCPELFERDGVYADAEGDFEDNGERYSVFCQAVLDACERLMGGAPKVFHCHDWQTGLLPVLMRTHRRDMLATTRTVFTIHNLPWSTFTQQGLEFYDQVNALKGRGRLCRCHDNGKRALRAGDSTPPFGCYLDGFLRDDCSQLDGLRNGIDVGEWNPATDAHIAQTFEAGDPTASSQAPTPS